MQLEYTAQQVAQLVGCDPLTLKRRAKKKPGTVPAALPRLGPMAEYRFRQDVVKAWLAKRELHRASLKKPWLRFTDPKLDAKQASLEAALAKAGVKQAAA